MVLKNLRMTWIKREEKTFRIKKKDVSKDGLWITLIGGASITYDMLEELKAPYDSDKIPAWLNEYDSDNEDNYINLFTQYELPVMIGDRRFLSIEDAISDGEVLPKNAIVDVSITIGESAIYPKAIKIIENGEEITSNPFEDFE